MTTADQITPPVATSPANNETALRATERFLQSARDALSAQIAILDERGTISKVNAAWYPVAGKNHFKDSLRGGRINYRQTCDSACGGSSAEAPLMSAT